MKHVFRRKKTQTLPQETAAQILSHVFAEANREPNSVPLEALVSYSNYRKERYALQRSVIVVILLLFLLLPLLFFAARVYVVPLTGEGENPVYAVSVQTKIPVRQIQATMDGRSVPVYEDAPGVYTVSPRENGELHIGVTLLNRQYTQVETQVSRVDMDVPVLVSTSFDESYVYLTVEDPESGVDFDAVRVYAQDGSSFAPAGTDAQTGCIRLAYPQAALDVHIPDTRGNVLRIQLKPQEGD